MEAWGKLERGGTYLQMVWWGNWDGVVRMGLKSTVFSVREDFG